MKEATILPKVTFKKFPRSGFSGEYICSAELDVIPREGDAILFPISVVESKFVTSGEVMKVDFVLQHVGKITLQEIIIYLAVVGDG